MGMCLDHQRDYQIWHSTTVGKPSPGGSDCSTFFLSDILSLGQGCGTVTWNEPPACTLHVRGLNHRGSRHAIMQEYS